MLQNSKLTLQTFLSYTILTPLNKTHPTDGRSSTPRNCQWAEFGRWDECSKPCGVGVQRRYRTIGRQADIGGSPCRTGRASETRFCNRQPCGSGQIFYFSDFLNHGLRTPSKCVFFQHIPNVLTD